jgi:hypothetical protein
MAMMAITTSSSINVKAGRFWDAKVWLVFISRLLLTYPRK